MKKILIPFLIFIFSLTFISCGKKEKEELTISGPDEVALDTNIVLECNYHDSSDIKWSSSDEATALVVFSGSSATVTGLKLGEVEISVSASGLTTSKKIRVVAGSKIVDISGPIFMFEGAKVTYRSNMDVSWNSSDESILTINSNGEATAIKSGEASIIAKSASGLEASLNIKVFPKDFEFDIEIDPLLIVGSEKQVIVKTDLIELMTDVTYSSSDESVATVSNIGQVKAISSGKATITATLYGKSASVTIEVVEDPNAIRISGDNACRIDQTIFLTCNYDCNWESSNDDVALVLETGEICPIGIGKCVITATDKENPNNKATFELEIIGKTPRTITINNKNYVGLNQEVRLDVSTFPSTASKRFIYETNNPIVATVDNNGVVRGLAEGEAVITVYSFEDKSIFASITLLVTMPAPKNITLKGDSEMMQGGHNYLEVSFDSNDCNKNLEWSSSDNKIAIVYDGIVLAVNKGEVTIRATSSLDKDIYGEITINVTKYVAPKADDADLARVREIMSTMTLEQKLGQMFVVGFSGTEISSDLIKAIENYHMGNVIYMGANCTDYTTLAKMSNDIQTKMIQENKVGAFISTDQEGGTVARLKVGGTHFISNMAMGATGDYNNTYLEGVACGAELRNYGINVDFAPVLDVNNNPNNPVIGVRSYSDNPLKVSLYGKNMYLGLMESGVMGTCKHFPGHGNTSTDSHYGLPTITTAMNELYQTELAPYISSITNGIDAIMTTHIIFTAIDKDYPATLSYKVLTNLLREELGFDGVIFTDGMEMAAVTNNFGSYDATGVLAVKAGVDILTYTTTANPIKAYNGIMAAIKAGEITEERIDASVERILLKKLKYGILDDPFAKNEDLSEMLEAHEELNNNFASAALTRVRGDFTGLDKDKKALIISPTTSNSLGDGLNSNSLGAFATKYLTDLGFDIEYYDVSSNISSSQRTTALKLIDNFDVIILAFSNVKKSGHTNTANFVKEVCKLDKEVIVFGLDSPYDISSYGTSVTNYFNIYGYQKASVVAISRFLAGEIDASGISSVALDK